jgi:hypothetical protein
MAFASGVKGSGTGVGAALTGREGTALTFANEALMTAQNVNPANFT